MRKVTYTIDDKKGTETRNNKVFYLINSGILQKTRIHC